MSAADWVDHDVQLTIIVNIPVHAANPDFTKDDAKDHAISAVIDAIENYTQGTAEVMTATAVEV